MLDVESDCELDFDTSDGPGDWFAPRNEAIQYLHRGADLVGQEQGVHSVASSKWIFGIDLLAHVS